MTLERDSAVFGLNDVKLYPTNGSGGWGTGFDVPKVVQYAPNVEIGGKMLEGDDTEDQYSYVKGYGAKLAFNKIPMDVLSATLGGSIIDSGSAPSQKTSYTFAPRGTSLPLFKLAGQMTKVDDGLGDAHITLTNCRVKPGTYDIGAKYGDYVAITLDVWIQDQPVIDFNETAIALVVAPDTTPPTISSTVPADAATGISKTANLSVTFSEAVQAGDVTADHFILTTDAGVAAAATLTLNTPTNTIVTINPTSDLDATTEYLLVITGVHDVAGNVLASPTIINFTTGA